MRSGSVGIVVLVSACGSFGTEGPSTVDSGAAGPADAASDAAPDVDASNPIYSVRCDKNRCTSLFVCCAGACTDPNACTSSTNVYTCDDQEDCAARGMPLHRCCGRVDGANITGSRCSISCAGNEIHLCTQTKTPDECSAEGKSCGVGGFNAGFGFCK